MTENNHCHSVWIEEIPEKPMEITARYCRNREDHKGPHFDWAQTYWNDVKSWKTLY